MNVTFRVKSAPTLKLRYLPGISGPQGDQGNTGATGPANTLTIGAVTTLGFGISATASVTGTPPNQTLNLGLPQGAQGPSGSVTDGDKGDIVVSSAGSVWTLDTGVVSATKLASNAVTTAKILDANVTLAKLAGITTMRVLGRNEISNGAVEELDGGGVLDVIGAPAFIRTLLNDTTAVEACVTLGVGELFLGETDMAGSSTVSIEGFGSTYRELIFRVTDVLLASNSQNVGFRVKVGGSFRSDLNYRYSYQQRRSDGTTYVGAASEAGSAFPFTGTLSNSSAANAFSGQVVIAAPGTSDSLYKGIDWKSRYFIAPSTIVNMGDGHYVGTSGVIQGIQFFTSSGSFSTGKVAMYGVL